jgi:hypothetical protein
MPERWTEDDDLYLLSHYGNHDVELLARVLSRTPSSVRSRFYKIQRKPQQNDFLGSELSFFLERANRTVPTSLGSVPKAAIPADTLAKWTNKRRSGSAYRHTKTGYRPDLGITVRSGWEANVCRVLKSYAIPFEYEPFVFPFPVKRGNKHYTPDLFLPASEDWIEIKGYFDNDSRIKLKRFKKHYPGAWEAFTMIISKSSKKAINICIELEVPNILFYQDIAKAFKDRIEGWEG